MKGRTILVAGILVVACIGLSIALWPFAFTVVSIQHAEQLAKAQAFDPVSYVNGIWQSKILTTIEERATDLPIILGEIKPDENGLVKKDSLTAVSKQYGLITVGEACVFMVKGKGRVAAVDTQSSNGTIEVLLDGYPGPIKVLVYIGPRIPTDDSSVRDAVGFINFGDFQDQTGYGQVAAEINKRVSQEVLAPLNVGGLSGKSVSFYGAFTIRTFNLIDIDVKQIWIVPTQISATG